MKTNIVENYILEGIQKGIFVKKIETEDQLSQRFRMSKITVRNAINNLVNQGLLRKVQGSGVFVAPKDEDKIHINTDLVGFRERAILSNKTASSTVLVLKKISTPIDIQKKMHDIPKVFYYERINYFDNQEMAYEKGYIREDFFSNIKKKDLETSKYQFFKNQSHAAKIVDKIINPTIATTQISKMLKLQGKPPLIAMESIVYSESKEILDITITYYNPDKFSVKNTSIIK